MTYKETPYAPYDFANRRHIGPSPAEMAEMLQAVGAPSLDALIDEIALDVSGTVIERLDGDEAAAEAADEGADDDEAVAGPIAIAVDLSDVDETPATGSASGTSAGA